MDKREEERKILLYLLDHSGVEATVSEITKHLKMTRKTVLDRLTAMEKDELVALASADPHEVWGLTRKGMESDLIMDRGRK